MESTLKTILYITANREDKEFEEKVRQKLLEVKGNNDLISVSQEPINFGKNICVGKVGYSYQNALIQMLIGAEMAQTEYVAIAEADQLYPPGYFDFKTTGEPLYLYKNLWMLRHWDKNFFYHKEYGDWLAIVKTKYLIKRLRLQVANKQWGNNMKVGSIFRKRQWNYFDGLPVVTIKTKNQTTTKSGFTGRSKWTEETRPKRELPHWGNVREFHKYFDL